MDSQNSKLQLFRIGSRQFGVPQNEIATVANWRKPTPLPHAPGSVIGVVSLQGRMLTVLDLATLPERQDAARNGSPQHLIALRGDEQLALAADELGETVDISNGDLETPKQPEKFVLGTVQVGGAEVNILSLKELFAGAIQGHERRRRQF